MKVSNFNQGLTTSKQPLWVLVYLLSLIAMAVIYIFTVLLNPPSHPPQSPNRWPCPFIFLQRQWKLLDIGTHSNKNNFLQSPTKHTFSPCTDQEVEILYVQSLY